MLEQYLDDVNRFMELHIAANVKISVKKWDFSKEKVVVLGFKVSKAKINPNLEKV